MRKSLVHAAMLVLGMWLFPASASADTIRILAAGAAKSSVLKLIPQFEAETGHKVAAEFDTVGAIEARTIAGEKVDLVLLSAVAIQRVAAASRPIDIMELGKTGVGLAVQAGQTKPKLADMADFVALVRAAPSIGYADPKRGPTAGVHFDSLIEKLGLRGELAAKLRLYPSGIQVITALQKGEIAMGVSQGTEIVGHAGVEPVGLLPNELQLWTVYLAARYGDSDATKAFASLLTGPKGQAALIEFGFTR